MTLRDHCTETEREAHELLDLAKAGVDVPEAFILQALAILGEPL